MKDALQNVTVFSCSHPDWIRSSHTMGEILSKSLQNAVYTVTAPITPKAFAQGFVSCRDILVIHTHGSDKGLYDARNNTTPTIISIEEICALPCNPSIQLILITACSTASGDKTANIAAEISKKIHTNGIVIANRHTVIGASETFSAQNNESGWVAYNNGEIMLTPDELPTVLDLNNCMRLLENEFQRLSSLRSTTSVSVIGCRNKGWMASSREMGRILADAIGNQGDYAVKAPANPNEFKSIWQSSDFSVIIHTFGNESSLLEDQGGRTRVIVDIEDLKTIPYNAAIQLVIITAGCAATRMKNECIASVISKKISTKGIVIANEGWLYGDASEFSPCDNSSKWLVYQNGVLLETYPESSFFLSNAYKIYQATFPIIKSEL